MPTFLCIYAQECSVLLIITLLKSYEDNSVWWIPELGAIFLPIEDM